ncbi:MAG: type II toxin-antitoxin system PemK/MazF family toxin [Eubacteriales bacterium]|nr:type II toxin-antitoxin system PemK/MazF family toxin [Eubacteriales bacterium]
MDKVSRIVSVWDERIANEPKVSYRNGKFHVFDGQHTILAREALNNDKPVDILCKVYTGLSAHDEALLFALQMGISSKPSSGERLRANIFGEEAEAIAFCKATTIAGLNIDLRGVRHKGHLGCVSTALKAYRALGEEQYIKAMQIIFDAWGGKSDSLRFEIVKAVTEFVELTGDDFERDKLVKKLSAISPMTIRDKINSDTETPSNKKYAYQIMKVLRGRSKAA